MNLVEEDSKLGGVRGMLSPQWILTCWWQVLGEVGLR